MGSQVMLGGVARNVCRVGSREARILTSTSATNASPTSSASLSTTSSSEAQEALKHVDRLDRNRDGTKRLNYAIVGPSELSTVNNLLYATYHPYEPLTSHLGLCNGLNSMKDMDRMVESYLVKNLTLIAYDRGTGRPVGAAVNNSCLKEELDLSLEQELKEVEDKSYSPIQAIHHQLRHENGHIFEEIGTNKMFSIKTGIGEEDRGQGVATNLIRRSILLAGCLGFRAIKTEATGRFSKETFQRVGMQPAGSIKYDDFVFEGKKVFEGIGSSEADSQGNPDTEITFMKKKFFQSALKHIL